MLDLDIEIRNATYAQFVVLGRPPTAHDIAIERDMSADDVVAAWRRLHEQHALVLNSSDEIRMVNPFSAVPTTFRVSAGGRWWYANCAWDAFGICAALHVDGRIETSCPDCGESVSVAIVDQLPDDESLLFHCLVPAAQWWNDIVFT